MGWRPPITLVLSRQRRWRKGRWKVFEIRIRKSVNIDIVVRDTPPAAVCVKVACLGLVAVALAVVGYARHV
jgi:hypothetical protein